MRQWWCFWWVCVGFLQEPSEARAYAHPVGTVLPTTGVRSTMTYEGAGEAKPWYSSGEGGGAG